MRSRADAEAAVLVERGLRLALLPLVSLFAQASRNLLTAARSAPARVR